MTRPSANQLKMKPKNRKIKRSTIRVPSPVAAPYRSRRQRSKNGSVNRRTAAGAAGVRACHPGRVCLERRQDHKRAGRKRSAEKRTGSRASQPAAPPGPATAHGKTICHFIRRVHMVPGRNDARAFAPTCIRRPRQRHCRTRRSWMSPAFRGRRSAPRETTRAGGPHRLGTGRAGARPVPETNRGEARRIRPEPRQPPERGRVGAEHRVRCRAHGRIAPLHERHRTARRAARPRRSRKKS